MTAPSSITSIRPTFFNKFRADASSGTTPNNRQACGDLLVNFLQDFLAGLNQGCISTESSVRVLTVDGRPRSYGRLWGSDFCDGQSDRRLSRSSVRVIQLLEKYADNGTARIILALCHASLNHAREVFAPPKNLPNNRIAR